ncbi:MAG TPA: type IV pilus biogenesis/stability protein PilW [Casimicrobiaceae bacterium]|nr:type IV pilus biogenesis/stability protein PilW [Casimicrobiaceae bacterium]
MRQRRSPLALVTLFAVLAIAGCATKPATPTPQPVQDTTPIKQEQATPQQRAKIHTELAAGYYQRGQMDIALQELGVAKALDPTDAKIYNVYGLVYAMLGEETKAEDNFRQALSLAPRDSEIRENWGAFLCGTGHPKEALPEFEAVMRDPLYKHPEIALINAGKCSAALGDVQKADDYLRRALTVSPGNPIASYNLALLSYRAKNYGEARVWMHQVMRQASPPPEALLLGMCIERNGGPKDAERSFEAQLRNRYPDSPEAKAIASGACP